jgi:hypothetical protein
MKRLNVKRLFLTIKKATLASLLFGGLNQSATAQNPLWILPTNDTSSKYLDWSQQLEFPLPTTDPATGQAYTDPDVGYTPSIYNNSFRKAANAMVDKDGNLLFFIVGRSIFDYQGRTIFNGLNPNFIDFTTCGQGYDEVLDGENEIVILPDPSNCSRFYVFTSISTECANEPATAVYFLLDLSKTEWPNVPTAPYYYFNGNPNARGQIVEMGILPNQYINEQIKGPKLYMTATSVDPVTKKAYLFVKKNNSFHTGLFVYEVGVNGISNVQNIYLNQEYPGTIDVFSQGLEIEVFKKTNGDYNLALSGSDGLSMATFNHNNMSLAPTVVNIHYCSSFPSPNTSLNKGLEFSPNGRYIYQTRIPLVNNEICNTSKVICWDTQLNTFVNLPWIGSFDDEFRYSYIEKYNDKLYVIKDDYMGEISNPNDPSNSTFNSTFLPVSYIHSDLNNVQPYNIELEKFYHLPHQLDDADYLTFMTTDPLCCIASTKFDVEHFDAHTDANFPSTTQVWTPTNNPLNGGSGTVATVTNELNIPEGYNIIIQDMVIKFLPDAELNIRRGISQKGGQLELKNSTLTVYDDCGGNFFWQGVDVEGYYNQPQPPLNNTHQGVFIVSNRSKVEYAVVGAEAIQDINGSYDNNYTGGIIRSDRATWRNNQMDVKLLNYNPGSVVNQCSFVRSRFITDVYLPELEAVKHVYLFGVGNLYFKGNRFDNIAYNTYAENLRGWGIFASNSKFDVIPSVIGNTYRPRFSNLAAGVIASSGGTYNTVNIDGGIFTNNQFGVGYFGLTFSRVVSSNFKIAENSNNSRTGGIFLYSCTGYQIEANKLVSDPTTSTNGETYGIIVHNSGPVNNFIYRNTFKNLKIGGQTQRINGQQPDFANNNLNVGLKWQCNNFKSNINVSDLTLTSGNMDYQQGLPAGGGISIDNAGARNLFSHDVDVSANEFDFFMNPIVTPPNYNDVIYGVNYRYYPSNFFNDNSITEPQNGNYTTGYFGNPYTHIEKAPVYNSNYTYHFNYAQSCPSQLPHLIGGNGSLSYNIATIKDVKQQIADKTSALNTTDQAALLNAVNSGTMSNGQLKNVLLSNSPMLSDEVIIAYIESNPPNGHLLQVLFNNGPLSSNVIQALNDNNALSNWWLIFISNYFVGTSPYNQAVSEIKYLTDLKDYKIDDYIRYYMILDTNVANPIDSVISVLELEPESKYRRQQLVDAYIYKKELIVAQTKNNELKTDFGVDNFTDLVDIRIAKTFGPCLVHNINVDPTSKTQVEQIVTDSLTDKIISTKAKCYLFDYADPSTYDYIIEDLYIQSGSGLKVGNNAEETEVKVDNVEDKTIISNDFALTVYPNPANETLHISIQGLSDEDNAVIEIANVSGQVVYKGKAQNIVLDVNINNLPKGMYFVMVRTEKQMLKVEKVIVE